jgi:hypothetical protein
MRVDEYALFRPELDLYLAVAAGYDFPLAELRMRYPIALAVSFAGGIQPRRFSGRRRRRFS